MRNASIMLVALLACGAVHAADVKVQNAWARGTVPAQKSTGAFLELTSSEDANLVGASSPIAAVVEIHSMKMEDGMMKMRQIPRLQLPARTAVKLAPGGNHIMLMELKQQLKKGDTVPLTLKIEGRDKQVSTVEVKAEVRDVTAPAPAHGGH